MKADTSFKEYAEYYDLIYKDKDYEKEIDFLEEIFGESKPKISSKWDVEPEAIQESSWKRDMK